MQRDATTMANVARIIATVEYHFVIAMWSAKLAESRRTEDSAFKLCPFCKEQIRPAGLPLLGEFVFQSLAVLCLTGANALPAYGQTQPPKIAITPEAILKFCPKITLPNTPSSVPPTLGPSTVPWTVFPTPVLSRVLALPVMS
jgi:hypothetical protein